MKTRNFPSRRLARRDRAAARREGRPQPVALPHVDDTRFRVGASKRRGERVTSGGAVLP